MKGLIMAASFPTVERVDEPEDDAEAPEWQPNDREKDMIHKLHVNMGHPDSGFREVSAARAHAT